MVCGEARGVVELVFVVSTWLELVVGVVEAGVVDWRVWLELVYGVVEAGVVDWRVWMVKVFCAWHVHDIFCFRYVWPESLEFFFVDFSCVAEHSYRLRV